MKLMENIALIKNFLNEAGKDNNNIFKPQDVDAFFEQLTMERFHSIRNDRNAFLTEMLTFQVKKKLNAVKEKANIAFAKIMKEINQGDKRFKLSTDYQKPTYDVEGFLNYNPFGFKKVNTQFDIWDSYVGYRDIVLRTGLFPERNLVTEFFELQATPNDKEKLVQFLKQFNEQEKEFFDYVQSEIKKWLVFILDYCGNVEKEIIAKWGKTLFSQTAKLDVKIIPFIKFSDQKMQDIHFKSLKPEPLEIEVIVQTNTEKTGLFDNVFNREKTFSFPFRCSNQVCNVNVENLFTLIVDTFGDEMYKIMKDIAKDQIPTEMLEKVHDIHFDLDLDDKVVVRISEGVKVGVKFFDLTEEDILSAFKKKYVASEISNNVWRKRNHKQEAACEKIKGFLIVDTPLENGYDFSQRIISSFINCLQICQFTDEIFKQSTN